MLDNLYIAIFTLLFLVGVIAVLYAALMRVIRPRGEEINYIVTVLDERERNAVARISYLLTRVAAAGDKACTRIIALDNGMTAEQYKAVSSAFSAEPCVVLCPAASLEAVLFKKR